LNYYVPASHYGLVEQAHSVLAQCLSDAAALAVKNTSNSRSHDDSPLLAA